MTDHTDDSFARYEEQEKRRKTLAAELRISTKAKLFDLLQAATIARVTVAFDGQGDSGQIEDISAFSEAKSIKIPRGIPCGRLTIQTAKHDGTGAEEATLPLPEVIENLCYELLELDNDGWEINEGAFGEFEFHVGNREIVLTFNYRISDVETSTHTF